MEDQNNQGRDNTKQSLDDDHDHHQRLRHVDSDLALAVALQNQESAFSSLETIDSESEISSDEASYDHEDYDFFESGGSASLGFLEDEVDDDDEYYSDEDEDEEMDDLDVDELTYEELIALGEFIGVEERGLSPKEISSCLRPIVRKTTSSSSLRQNGVVIDRCVVCQVEYEEEGDQIRGEDLVALGCEHLYHSECITKWLQIKKCCPICSFEVSSSSSSSPSSTTSKN